MKILVVGSGGREHAIAWRLAQDAEGHEIFCAPGNAGTGEIAANVDLKADDVAGIVAWARAERSSSRRLRPRPMIRPSRTITQPTGTSPAAAASSARTSASRIQPS